MEINDKIFDQIMNPFIIADCSGKILRTNEPIAALMRASGTQNIEFMKDIDPLFRPNMPIRSPDMRVLRLGTYQEEPLYIF
jgi:hypothetical protein